ncbi:Protein RSI-1 [Cocos nucifera]|uniref:Protein RSI-1 n=1 Tax=Cocos nucifera TaxID=13894 RepID=A0A8K0IGU5_COCNU|nr:Protein RSI-1 [Cocos nucifera]
MAAKHPRVSYSLLVFLLLALCFFGSVHGLLKPSDCQPRCQIRCSATSHKKPCMFFCLKCCAQCLCVPPGTYGNKQMCPCYNNWKTKGGGPKCP